MKINNLQGMNINPYKKQAEKYEQIQSSNRKDKIEISSEAKQLQKLGTFEAERKEKVEAIKKQVESGNYEINPRKIAEKMYSFWDEMK